MDRNLLKTNCISFLLGQPSAIFDMLSDTAGTGYAGSHVNSDNITNTKCKSNGLIFSVKSDLS